jgi:hypothetical protein
VRLKLLINNEEKVFTIPFVSGMVLRKYMELLAKTRDSKNLTVEEMDEYVGLVIYAFKNQFTLEEFYDGIPHEKVMQTVDSLFIPTSNEDSTESKKK